MGFEKIFHHERGTCWARNAGTWHVLGKEHGEAQAEVLAEVSMSSFPTTRATASVITVGAVLGEEGLPEIDPRDRSMLSKLCA